MVDEVEQHAAAVHRRDAARLARLVMAVAVAGLIVVLALDNRDDTRVGYLWGDATFPLWTVIVGSAVGGVVFAGLIRFRARHRRA